MAVEFSTTQSQACQGANGHFCSITTPFQPLANPPSCIAALYVKSKVDITSKCSVQICKASATNLLTQVAPGVWILTIPATAPLNTMTLICLEKPMATIPIQKPIHIPKLPMACSATSSNFTYHLDMKLQLWMLTYLSIWQIFTWLNISAQDFCIWQHLGNNRSDIQLQHLTTIPSISVHKFTSIFSIAPYQSCPLIQNQQGTLIPSGLCLHIWEYTFQL